MANRRRFILLTQQGLMALFAFVLIGCGQPTQLELHGVTMGTTFSIKLPRPPGDLRREVLQAEVDNLLVQINSEMSTYDHDSALSRFNQTGSDVWVDLPPRLMQVLNVAAEIHRLSDGVFDPTVGPLVNLWGFGPKTGFSVPAKQKIAEARKEIGFNALLEIDVDKQRVRKKRAAVYVDLSAIAKGFAVDEVGELLSAHGVNEYMVEIGGEIRVAGLNAHKKPWRLAIENPSTTGRSVHGLLSVTDAAVATSGDYRNFFEHEGKRYSHTIDPRTGYPVDHALVSVTVVHPNAITADALATALMVLGPESGMKVAKEHDFAVWFIVRQDNEWIDLYSPAIENYRVN